MKKNLLALLVVCFFTLVVVLVINDMSNTNSPQVETQYTTVD